MGGGGVLQGYLATVGYYLLVLVTQIFSSRAWWGFETNSSLGLSKALPVFVSVSQKVGSGPRVLATLSGSAWRTPWGSLR
jgi:hypothetical protein